MKKKPSAFRPTIRAALVRLAQAGRVGGWKATIGLHGPTWSFIAFPMDDDRARLIKMLNLTISEASALPTYRNAAYGVCVQYLNEIFPHKRLGLVCRHPAGLGVRSIVSLLLDEGPGAVIAALDRAMRHRDEPI